MDSSTCLPFSTPPTRRAPRRTGSPPLPPPPAELNQPTHGRRLIKLRRVVCVQGYIYIYICTCDVPIHVYIYIMYVSLVFSIQQRDLFPRRPFSLSYERRNNNNIGLAINRYTGNVWWNIFFFYFFYSLSRH